MEEKVRFDLRLVPAQRQELDSLSRELGISRASLVRLGIGLILQNRGLISRPISENQGGAHEQRWNSDA
jgi:hypothetical protein